MNELALAVISVPTERIEEPALAASPAAVLSALRLRPVAEIPSRFLNEAVAALLANEDVYEAAEWLRQSPNPVPLELGEDVLTEVRDRATTAHGVDEWVPSLPRPPSPPALKDRGRKLSKSEPLRRSFGPLQAQQQQRPSFHFSGPRSTFLKFLTCSKKLKRPVHSSSPCGRTRSSSCISLAAS